MQLDPQILKFVQFCEAFEANDSAEEGVEAERRRYLSLCNALEGEADGTVASSDVTVERSGRRIPVRLYRPRTDKPHPFVVFFHGGGWVLGDLDSHHHWAAELCALSGLAVVAVDYRLSPEHVYPAALEDGFDVLGFFHDQAERFGLDRDRIGVYGDSAGGNLAAALCLLSRDRLGPDIRAQILVYPALGLSSTLPSYTENSGAPILTTDAMEVFVQAYLGEQSPDGYAAPLSAADLSGLPAAFVMTAQYDPLRDDGLYYVEKLNAAGGRAELWNGEGLVHACMRARHRSDRARAAFDLCAAKLRELVIASP